MPQHPVPPGDDSPLGIQTSTSAPTEIASPKIPIAETVRVGLASADFAVLVAPEIEGEEGAAHEVGLVGEELEGFGDLDGEPSLDIPSISR